MSPAVAWSADVDDRPGYEVRTELARRDFGELHFVMGAGRAMQWLEMYSGKTLLAAIRNFAAEEVVASPDGQYFLALSNSSDSSLAFAVLDRRGHVVVSSPHGSELHYCRRTNWGIGEWVDARAPQATFRMEKNQLALPAAEYLSVTVRGCDGKTVMLGRIPSPDAKPVDVYGRKLPPVPATTECTSSITPTAAADGQGGSFFIGRTIACLRGLDTTYGERIRMLIDDRRVISPSLPGAAPTPASAPAPAQ